MQPDPNDQPLIQASELAQYSFCRRAWWLGTVEKMQTDNQASLSRGQKAHGHHERKVQYATRWRQTGFLLMGAGSLFLIVTLFWLWLGAG